MSDFVKVPYAELLQRASRIRQEADVIRAEIRTLREAVESIQWMGQRAERFFTMWEESVPEMEAWVETLEGFATDLETQAQRMQAADQSL